jgi:hypothetical protein
MAAGDDAEILRTVDAGKRHEGAQVVLVRAPDLPAVEVGEPLDLGRNLGKLAKLGGSQSAASGRRSRSCRGDNQVFTHANSSWD